MKNDQDFVIFRKDRKTGDTFALFPYIFQSLDKPWVCQSYQHIGQHSAAVYLHCINTSVPANPKEYKDLYKELTDELGYILRVGKHINYKKRSRLFEEFCGIHHYL